jgi:methylated-DNA-protein-cysteine methyltransferase-like protein
MATITLHQEIYQIVALIPYGRVATYGQIARLAGLPKHARLVGYALNGLDTESDLPWHRVVNSQGKLSLQKMNEQAENIQKIKLEQEGIVFQNDKIRLKDYQWQP